MYGRRLDTISINQSQKEPPLEDFKKFQKMQKILFNFKNRQNKEYLLQLREHFKRKNDKVLDKCNKGDNDLVCERNK